MPIPYNIEPRKILPSHNYRVGYTKSTRQAIRIYGDSRHGYKVSGHYCRTLAEVSARLESM